MSVQPINSYDEATGCRSEINSTLRMTATFSLSRDSFWGLMQNGNMCVLFRGIGICWTETLTGDVNERWERWYVA